MIRAIKSNFADDLLLLLMNLSFLFTLLGFSFNLFNWFKSHITMLTRARYLLKQINRDHDVKFQLNWKLGLTIETPVNSMNSDLLMSVSSSSPIIKDIISRPTYCELVASNQCSKVYGSHLRNINEMNTSIQIP